MTDVTQASLVQTVRFGPVRRLAIVVSMLLVLAAAAASLFLVRTVDNQMVDIGNTYEVRRQARDLMLAVVNAVSAHIGMKGLVAGPCRPARGAATPSVNKISSAIAPANVACRRVSR